MSPVFLKKKIPAAIRMAAAIEAYNKRLSPVDILKNSPAAGAMIIKTTWKMFRALCFWRVSGSVSARPLVIRLFRRGARFILISMRMPVFYIIFMDILFPDFHFYTGWPLY